jgi:urea transporter
VLAVLLQPGFTGLGLPALTASFILACWLVLASQRLLRNAAMVYGSARTEANGS